MAEYLGLKVSIPSNDTQHIDYLQQQSKNGKLTMPVCNDCSLMHYPPSTMCPECHSTNLGWKPVSGKGTVHSYVVIPHAINPAFKNTGFLPYPLVLIELDEQRGVPTEHRALRMVANIVKDDGNPEVEENLAIGKRVEAKLIELGDGMALPQFKMSNEPPEHTPWQWPSNA